MKINIRTNRLNLADKDALIGVSSSIILYFLSKSVIFFIFNSIQCTKKKEKFMHNYIHKCIIFIDLKTIYFFFDYFLLENEPVSCVNVIKQRVFFFITIDKKYNFEKMIL